MVFISYIILYYVLQRERNGVMLSIDDYKFVDLIDGLETMKSSKCICGAWKQKTIVEKKNNLIDGRYSIVNGELVVELDNQEIIVVNEMNCICCTFVEVALYVKHVFQTNCEIITVETFWNQAIRGGGGEKIFTIK